ncbi:MAG: hypothetical protein ACK46X_21660 [Candidatus Sericytochromatia bacterium]
MSERSIEGPLGEDTPARTSTESVTPGGPSFEGEHGERVESGRTAGIEEGPGEAEPV